MNLPASLGSKVLVATDLSDAADEAIRQGHARARAAGGQLVVCHVIPSPLHANPLFPQRTGAETEGVLDATHRAIQAIEQRVTALTGAQPGPGGQDGDTFQVVVETGTPEAAIVRAADQAGASLVAIGSRGLAGIDRLLLGSVAERVVRYAHCPVLVARPHEKTGKILAATDFSEAALAAVAVAAAEARATGARLTLLHANDLFPSPAIGWGAPFGASWVIPPQELVEQVQKSAAETLRTTLERYGVPGDTLTPTGDAVTAILSAARTLPADLIVLATRGRTGIARMVLGSVAEKVIELAPCSVLAVRTA
jgi:nucleotide-binding universal stress UspA family protein